MLTTLFGWAGPYLVDLAVTVAIPAALAWGFQVLRKIGIDIDQAHRESYTAAAQRVAGELINKIMNGSVSQVELTAAPVTGGTVIHPDLAAAVSDLQKAAPDALKHFGLTNNVTAIAKKILGMVGVLMAPGALTPEK